MYIPIIIIYIILLLGFIPFLFLLSQRQIKKKKHTIMAEAAVEQHRVPQHNEYKLPNLIYYNATSQDPEKYIAFFKKHVLNITFQFLLKLPILILDTVCIFSGKTVSQLLDDLFSSLQGVSLHLDMDWIRSGFDHEYFLFTLPPDASELDKAREKILFLRKLKSWVASCIQRDEVVTLAFKYFLLDPHTEKDKIAERKQNFNDNKLDYLSNKKLKITPATPQATIRTLTKNRSTNFAEIIPRLLIALRFPVLYCTTKTNAGNPVVTFPNIVSNSDTSTITYNIRHIPDGSLKLVPEIMEFTENGRTVLNMNAVMIKDREKYRNFITTANKIRRILRDHNHRHAFMDLALALQRPKVQNDGSVKNGIVIPRDIYDLIAAQNPHGEDLKPEQDMFTFTFASM